jgi:hypothetical protein
MTAIFKTGISMANMKNFTGTGAIYFPYLAQKTAATSAKVAQAVSENVVPVSNEPSYLLALFAGLNSSVLASIIWAEMNHFIEIKQAVFAVSVGCMTGLFVRWFGRGKSKNFGWLAIFFSLFSCFLGSALNVISFLSLSADMGYAEILITMNPEFIGAIMAENFAYPDIFAYFIMSLTAYKISFKPSETDTLFRKFQNRMSVPQKDAAFNF